MGTRQIYTLFSDKTSLKSYLEKIYAGLGPKIFLVFK
jgi:hypothetical protein